MTTAKAENVENKYEANRVWAGVDAKAYLCRMNVALIATMFGSNIAKAMGEEVLHNEEEMLEHVLE